ncbi:MAG: hypothetical protein IKY62_05570, partial [Clostridia bacterium]|nr:hypothetical protein [Clostridia bacterium]
MKKTNSLLARLVTLVLMICLVFSLAIVVSTAAEEPATLSFADKANRTEFSGTKQVWYQNGITFTNNKGSSTNAVADYSPVRLYAGSNVVIDAPGNITKIVFTTSGSSYATPLKNSIGSAATVTVSGSEVTVTPNGTSESFTVAKLTAQVRLNSITVTYESGGCAHPNTKEEITKQADCTTDGSKTVTCTSCGETKVETVSATGHAGGEPSCTALAKCGTCGEEYGKLLPHNFEDGRCDVCGAEMPLEATISFANADQRQSLSTTQQVWKADGIVFTHNKSASTTNIADYTAPARFYKSSQIIIEGESSISKIVFNAPSGDYGPNKWQDSIGNVDGATVTVDGNDVIVEFRTPVMSFEIAAMSAQGRLNYITVTFVKDESQPEAPSYETNASVMLGKDLAMIYDVVVPAGTPTMVIEFANETVTLNGTSNDNVTYTFIFDGIGPH